MANEVETKHTPGPWNVEGCEQCPERGRIYIHARGWLDPNELIAETCKTDRDVDNDRVTEAEANARLIAAAPDLLSALKECALQIAQTHNRKLTGSEQAALDAAKAAISRAETGV